MLQLIVKIETVNAAFDGNEEGECARILKEIARQLEVGATPMVRDINGNRCGSIEIVG